MADNLPQDVVEATGNKLLKAMTAHLNRTTPGACAELVDPARRIFRVSRRQSGNEFPVSLIVPTRNYYGLLSNCITGILEHTDYRNLEIIIVDNDSDDVITLEYLDTLRSNDRVSVIKYPGEFNYSAINNFAVEHCRHEYIGLINNDISVINTGWLSEMMGHLIRDEVGIVGAKLLYGNDTIQHAGVIIGLGGVAGHAFRHFPCNSPGVNDRLLLTQQLSCVTGACLLTKKSIYKSVGGLDQVNLKIAFNDVDYCLKVMDLGYKIIWTPYAELYHLESASRGFDLNDTNIERWQSEYDYMKNKWNFKLQDDPAYNPNLTIGTEDFTLSNRPRINKPWASFNE
ncbi:MAG TPA: glycosyltransferase, partial [Gammaproteobacteria bacterium]